MCSITNHTGTYCPECSCGDLCSNDDCGCAEHKKPKNCLSATIMISLAKKIAKKAQHTFAFHSAIVQKGGAIISTGYNHDWVHAEIKALSSLWPSKRKGCVVWSVRVTRGGKLANAKPCASCEAYMIHWGIKAVWYSDDNGQMIRMDL